MASTFPLIARNPVLRQLATRVRCISGTSGRMSSAIESVKSDPGKYITGLTAQDIEGNEALQAYLEANFSEVAEPVSKTSEPVLETSIPEEEPEEMSNTNGADALNIRKLYCYKRDPVNEEGSRDCRRMRLTDFIPGVLYGGDPNQGLISKDTNNRVIVKTPWSELHRELDLYHRTIESRVYDLTIFEDPEDTVGEVHRVLARDVQRHPFMNKIYCINYLRYFPGRPIKLPIVYVNEEESPALKRDGYIIPINRFVECVIEDGVRIPDHIELECTGVRIKDVLRLDRPIFPEGVKPSIRVKPDFLIGPVFGRRGDDAADTAATAEGGDAEATTESK